MYICGMLSVIFASVIPYGEEPVWAGTSIAGPNYILTQNTERPQFWTLIEVEPEGQACIIAEGAEE